MCERSTSIKLCLQGMDSECIKNWRAAQSIMSQSMTSSYRVEISSNLSWLCSRQQVCQSNSKAKIVCSVGTVAVDKIWPPIARFAAKSTRLTKFSRTMSLLSISGSKREGSSVSAVRAVLSICSPRDSNPQSVKLIRERYPALRSL